MIDELVRVEIVRLRDVIRCETHDVVEIRREPAGGRIDPIASIRGSLSSGGSLVPDTWVVKRRERHVETPVNCLAAAILRRTERKLSATRRPGSASWQLLAGERTLLSHASRRLAHFMAESPLGQIQTRDEDPSALRRVAARRRSEYVRLKGLWDWWDRFRAIDLAALQSSADSRAELSVNTSYEILVAMGLLLALRERYPMARASTPTAVSFQSARAEIRLMFGPGVTPYRRGHTAMLEIHTTDGRVLPIVVEARAYSVMGAGEIVQRLELWQEAKGPHARAVLLTPTQVPAEAGTSITWLPFLPELGEGSACSPVDAWSRLLDRVLGESA